MAGEGRQAGTDGRKQDGDGQGLRGWKTTGYPEAGIRGCGA
jgi:hypothetical protein